MALCRPTYCSALHSASFALICLLSSPHSHPTAPPAGKAEKDNTGAKPVIQSKDLGFAPIDIYICILMLFGRCWEYGQLKGRHLTFLKLCNLPPSGKGQAPVFDVFEAFLNTDNIQVFANAATSYIMCLMKFVKGLGKWSPPFPPPDS